MNARRRDALLVAFGGLSVCAAWAWLIQGRAATGSWPGVDEAVIGHFVESSGSVSRPLLDWVHGDVLLFAFLVAGLAAGFVLGFFSRAALQPDQPATSRPHSPKEKVPT